MKYVLSIFVVFLACAITYTTADLYTQTAVTRSEYIQLESKVIYLNKEVRELRKYCEKDPNFFLTILDHDLDSIESGHDARGSFSDYFVPNMAKALKAGASKKEVEVRLDRAIVLAENGTYLSSFLAQLMSEGGPDAVRSYTFGWIGISQ